MYRSEHDSYTHPSDEHIIRCIHSMDEQGIRSLIRKYAAPAIVAIERRQTVRDPAMADDAVIEAALLLWRDPDRFDPSRGTLGSFFIGIAIKIYLNSLGSETRSGSRQLNTTDHECIPAPSRPEPAERQRSWDRAKNIRGTISAMPRLHRKIAEADLASASCRADTRELAQKLGITRGHAAVIRHRVKRALAHHHRSDRDRGKRAS